MGSSKGRPKSIPRWTPLLFGTVVLICVSFAPSGRGYASHYSWLGHSSEVPPNSTSLGTFVPTFYRILDETNWPTGERSEELFTREGQLIARVPTVFRHQLDIEGSARLRDGRIVNIDERVGGRMRYLIVRGAPFGVGAPGYRLVPYRTVAVDPRRIKLGTVLYIPSLVGIQLPTGEVHDGFGFAHDTGRGIIGSRIDIFVGFEGDRDNTLTRSGRVASQERIPVYAVDGATARVVKARFAKEFTWNE
jgi:3D (Asp-Asp-Asp) domain-containing protein